MTSQTLRPTLNSYYQTVEDAQLWLGTDKSVAQALIFVSLFNTVESPIMGFDSAQEEGRTIVVRRTSSLQFGGSWLVLPKLQVSADIGVNAIQDKDKNSYLGMDDVHLTAKHSLFQKPDEWGLSWAPDFYLPVKNKRAFISNGVTGYGGRVFFEKNFESFRVAINAGYLRFPGASYSVIDYSTQYPMGIGFRIPISSKVALNLEGTTTKIRGLKWGEGPGDFYLGSRISVFKGGVLSLGGSYGAIKLDKSSESASLRILVGLNILPRTVEPIKTISKETVKQFHTLQECNPKPSIIQLQARALEPLEKKLVLPYITSSEGLFKEIQFNQVTANRVRNSQMVFAIDTSVYLPKRSEVISMDALSLKMKVHPLIDPKDPRAGMLCFINEKICSGDFPSALNLRKQINPSFFKGKEPPNDFFIRSLLESSGREGIVAADVNLPLRKLLENSTTPDQMDIIYDSSGEPRKTLYFVVAHNILASEVQLEALVTTESCSTSNTETVLPPQLQEIEHKDDSL